MKISDAPLLQDCPMLIPVNAGEGSGVACRVMANAS